MDIPSNLAPLRFRYSTSEGLKRFNEDPSRNRNYFYLTNPDAARLFEKLTNEKVEFSLTWGDDKANDSSLVVFQIGDLKILSSENYKPLHFISNGKECFINQLPI